MAITKVSNNENPLTSIKNRRLGFGKRQTKNKEAVEAPKSQQCFDKLAKLKLIFMLMRSFNQNFSLKNKLMRLPAAECSLKKAVEASESQQCYDKLAVNILMCSFNHRGEAICVNSGGNFKAAHHEHHQHDEVFYSQKSGKSGPSPIFFPFFWYFKIIKLKLICIFHESAKNFPFHKSHISEN